MHGLTETDNENIGKCKYIGRLVVVAWSIDWFAWSVVWLVLDLLSCLANIAVDERLHTGKNSTWHNAKECSTYPAVARCVCGVCWFMLQLVPIDAAPLVK